MGRIGGKSAPTLNFQRAIDLMGRGSKLTLMHDPRAKGGKSYYVMPGGAVTDEVAAKLIASANITPNGDGLLPETPQSWSILSAG